MITSASEGLNEPRKGRFPIWPEWNETDINAEKWEGTKGSKDREKSGKSPCIQYFEDPEGKIELPQSLKVYTWKRPSEFMLNKTPVVVDNESWFDLVSANEHLIGSELIRWIISEIYTVWKICNGNTPYLEKQGSPDPSVLSWKPWEHIFSLCKVVKGHIPLYNVYGKYVVKLFWMGCWRKITVDDTLPFDEENNILLPATTCQTELWPMLLTKAIIKLANTEVHLCQKRELGEFTVLHALTGWLPEVIPLQTEYSDQIWDFLKETVPKFLLPEDDASEGKPPLTDSRAGKDYKTNEIDSYKSTSEKNIKGKRNVQPWHLNHHNLDHLLPSLEAKKDTSHVKDAAKKKGKEGEKEKKSLHSARPVSELPHAVYQTVPESCVSPQVPQMVVCASYLPLHLSEKKISVLGQMADSSERLRQYGLSQLYSHPVLITRTRSCPLVVPPKPPLIPRWKLIRQKKQTLPTDEPKEPAAVKPEKFIEIAGPFLNYRLNSAHMSSEQHYICCKRNKSTPLNTKIYPKFKNDVYPNTLTGKKSGLSRLKVQSSVSLLLSNNKDNPSVYKLLCTCYTDHKTSNAAHVTEHTTDSSHGMLRSQEEIVSEKPVLQETWIEFEDFFKCFQTLLVFHKPNTYANQFQKSDFKSPDEKGSHFLFVDSLIPTEILISFSALVHGGEAGNEKKDSSLQQSGLIIVEPFSCKCLTAQPPVLQIRTFATKASLLILPPGRYVLRFTARSPLGYHIHLCSTLPFVFGDEETIMPNLDKESLSFIEQAKVIMKAVGKVVNNFSDEHKLPLALKELELAYYPPGLHGTGKVKTHCEAFNNALYHTITKALGHSLTRDEKFAIRAFTYDIAIGSGLQENKSLVSWQDLGHRTEVPDSWYNREPTYEEIQAAKRLQAGLKGMFVREIRNARRPGTKENASAKKLLQEIWSALEPNAEQHALFLLRDIFTSSEKTVELYPCYKDEWTRTSFIDYSVNYQDQPNNSWFVVFRREVFFVPKDMLVVPKVYSSIPACVLHVIDNDTGEEVPKIFQKVVPHIYQKNQKGYTFMAEAHSGDFPLAAGKWKLRLIGSYNPLPVLSRDPANSSFAIKEFKDYYIPNKKHLICRFLVKVTMDHFATLQLQTSKPDVYVKLQILDNEEEVASSIGKGHVVIPAFTFFCNKRPSSSSSKCTQIRSLSGESRRERSTSVSSQMPGDEETTSRSEATIDQQPAELMHKLIKHLLTFSTKKKHSSQSHKYIIQALVLHKSWTLDDSQLAFVQVLKEMEKNYIKGRHDPSIKNPNPKSHRVKDYKSSIGWSTTPKSSRKGKDKPVEKLDKDKSGKEKEGPASRPDSQALDVSKPSWTLRVVSDSNDAETIDIRKDTERVDEIKAMKQAWETAEPGRSIKAMQSRLQFINKRLLKKTSEALDKIPSDKQVFQYQSSLGKSEQTVIGTMLNTDKRLVMHLGFPSLLNKMWTSTRQIQNLTPFISSYSVLGERALNKPTLLSLKRSPFIDVTFPSNVYSTCQKFLIYSYSIPQKSKEESVLKDDFITLQQEREKSEEFRRFRLMRDLIMEHREQEQLSRKELKKRQLEMYEQLQVVLDVNRQKILTARELYRSKLLESELRKQEEDAALEGARQAELEKNSPPRQKSPKRGKSSSKKK
uniref:Androglobin n=1 Tax=Lepisosteus oculatus TaxID=7918 RepID=W5NGY4_LEPOC